jgi:hypothetical protein
MNKTINFLLILALIFTSMSWAHSASANLDIYNVEVYDMVNGRVKIHWSTIEPTQARVYLGEDPNNLDRFYLYSEYDSAHDLTVSGLQKDTKYYFKIVAINRSGRTSESFLQTFSTKGMIDTIPPEFEYIEVIQTTKDRALVKWKTYEETRADVRYGQEDFNLNKKTSSGSYKTEHEVVIKSLYSKTVYYVKVIAKDRSGNLSTKSISFRSGSMIDQNTPLTISNVVPASFDSTLIDADEATIKWRTNMATKSKIRYGVQSGKYKRGVYVNKSHRELDHEILLTELEPNTTYYYQIHVYDSIYGKSKKSKEYTFTTSVYLNPVPEVKGVQTGGEFVDSDNDNLSDQFEYAIGTDPFNSDSDGDGYEDGSEFNNGWDPNVAGSSPDTRLQSFRYYMPKRDYDYRVQKDRELRLYVNNRLGNPSVSAGNWRKLSDAYIYGGYPTEAIVASIKHGGKTVHTEIPHSAWRNTQIYQDYINK